MQDGLQPKVQLFCQAHFFPVDTQQHRKVNIKNPYRDDLLQPYLQFYHKKWQLTQSSFTISLLPLSVHTQAIKFQSRSLYSIRHCFHREDNISFRYYEKGICVKDTQIFINYCYSLFNCIFNFSSVSKTAEKRSWLLIFQFS
jgi:hypothetical protein